MFRAAVKENRTDQGLSEDQNRLRVIEMPVVVFGIGPWDPQMDDAVCFAAHQSANRPQT